MNGEIWQERFTPKDVSFSKGYAPIEKLEIQQIFSFRIFQID
jgi:hypothetical protein